MQAAFCCHSEITKEGDMLRPPSFINQTFVDLQRIRLLSYSPKRNR